MLHLFSRSSLAFSIYCIIAQTVTLKYWGTILRRVKFCCIVMRFHKHISPPWLAFVLIFNQNQAHRFIYETKGITTLSQKRLKVSIRAARVGW